MHKSPTAKQTAKKIARALDAYTDTQLPLRRVDAVNAVMADAWRRRTTR